MAPSAEYGIAIVRKICVGKECRRYALTKSRLWVEAPWSVALLADPAGVLVASQVTRIGGVEVEVTEYVVVVSLAEARKLGMGEAILARLTREEAKTVAKALLEATGLRGVEARV